jgi:hypothetical protein
MNVSSFWGNITSADQSASNLISSIYLTNAALFGSFLNILVIYFYSHDKILRKPSNYFFINLAVTDLLMLVTTIPMSVISSFYGRWIFGKIG